MISRKNKNGFTLVELIATVAILAILAAIAVPVFSGLTDRANQGVEIAGAAAIANAITLHNHMNPEGKLTQVDVGGWATIADMEASALGTLAPKLVSVDFTKARNRVNVDANGIATATTTLN